MYSNSHCEDHFVIEVNWNMVLGRDVAESCNSISSAKRSMFLAEVYGLFPAKKHSLFVRMLLEGMESVKGVRI